MRKVLLLLVCLCALHAAAWPDTGKPIQTDRLPQQAQIFIKKFFPTAKVAMVKMETELLNKSYEVVFTNGDQLEFDKKGAWTEVNCKYNSVPADAVPEQIRQYVADNYPDAKVLKMEKDRKVYEIELSNGWEVAFDSKFNVIDIDN